MTISLTAPKIQAADAPAKNEKPAAKPPAKGVDTSALFKTLDSDPDGPKEGKDKVKPASADEPTKLKAVTHDSSLTEAQKKDKVAQIKKNEVDKSTHPLTKDGEKKLDHPELAKPAPSPEPTRRASLKNLMDDLHLSLAEQEKIKPVLAEEAAKEKAVTNDAALTSEQKNAKLAQVKKDADAKIARSLTKEHLKLFDLLDESPTTPGPTHASK